MNIFRRGVIILTLVSGAAVGLPAAAAQASGIGCSDYTGVPSVSVSYDYCARNWTVENEWQQWMDVKNNHGAAINLDTQVNIRIDGTDHTQPVRAWYLPLGTSSIDPYNNSYSTNTRNNCTNTHTYNPRVRARLHGGSWGAWASAYTFYC
jgi:hypothetical protein